MLPSLTLLSLVRVRVRVLGMFMPMLTVLVSRGRVFLGLLVLPMGVVVGGLEVVVGGRVMARGGLVVVLHGWVLVLFGHAASSGTRKGNGLDRNITRVGTDIYYLVGCRALVK